MNFGLFEPLFGKKLPEASNPPMAEQTAEVPRVSSPKITKKKNARIKAPSIPVSPQQLGNLFGELDRSHIIVILLCVAVVILMFFVFYLNSRQRTQKKLISSMNKQLKRLRG